MIVMTRFTTSRNKRICGNLVIYPCRSVLQFDSVGEPFNMDTDHGADITSIDLVENGKEMASIKCRGAQRKMDSRKLLVIVALLAVCGFVTVIVLSINYARLIRSSNICDTEECPRIGADTAIYSVENGKEMVSIKCRGAQRKMESRKLMVIVTLLAACGFVTVIALLINYAGLIRSSNICATEECPRIDAGLIRSSNTCATEACQRIDAGLIRSSNICDTEECLRIAASLKASMDTSVDPCDDFHKYACGRWHKAHPFLDSILSNSWIIEGQIRISKIIRDRLRRDVTNDIWAISQAKKLYASCLDEESINSLGLGTLRDLLDELGLPEVPAIFTGKTGNFVEKLAKVKKVLDLDVFFELKISKDPKNNSRNIIRFREPRTYSFPPGDKFGKSLQRSSKKQLDFERGKVYMNEVFTEVLRNGTNTSVVPNDEEIQMAITKMYRMNKSAKDMYLYPSRSDDGLNGDDHMLVDDLQKITDDYIKKVDSTLTSKQIWRPFLEELLDSVTDLDLGKDKILVEDMNFLMELALLWATADEQSEIYAETVIWWIVVDFVAPYSSESLRKAKSSFKAYVYSLENPESRSLHCAANVNKLMGMAVSRLIVDPTFHDVEYPKLREMLENIRAAFSSMVLQADWMDTSTIEAVLEKARRMSSVIGYPDWIFDNWKIDEYYKGINLSEDTYLDNMLQIVGLDNYYKLSKLRKENSANETEWTDVTSDVNAYHIYAENKISISAGIVQFPMYGLGLEALNYGAMGTIMGHEFTHGFDHYGRKFDSSGNTRKTWSDETIIEYDSKKLCFMHQYNEFYEKDVDEYADGYWTMRENLADNGSLKEALLAYRKWVSEHGQEPLLPGFTHLTHEQLLVLSFSHLWCDSYTAPSLNWRLSEYHCPEHMRVRGVLVNSHEFSEVWNCSIGSKMNPEKKCLLW